MQLTTPILIACGVSPAYAPRYVDALNELLPKYGINTLLRTAHLLSQLIHESAGFSHTLEMASGVAYEGRKSLGNINPGDGPKYRGRGLIQITGRFNYAALSKATKIDYLTHPEWLERPHDALLSALWYWNDRGINHLADKDDVIAVTKAINGGTNGLQARARYLAQCKTALAPLFTHQPA